MTDDFFSLSHAIFTGLGSSGTLSGSQFHTGAAATASTDRIIYNNTTGNIFYDADGSGAGAQIQFAHATAGLVLTAADFHLVA